MRQMLLARARAIAGIVVLVAIALVTEAGARWKP
jgi:hypothetical protein